MEGSGILCECWRPIFRNRKPNSWAGGTRRNGHLDMPRWPCRARETERPPLKDRKDRLPTVGRWAGRELVSQQHNQQIKFSQLITFYPVNYFSEWDKIKSPSTNHKKKKKKSLQKLRKKSRKHRFVQDKIRKFAPGCKSTECLFYRALLETHAGCGTWGP